MLYMNYTLLIIIFQDFRSLDSFLLVYNAIRFGFNNKKSFEQFDTQNSFYFLIQTKENIQLTEKEIINTCFVF